MWGNGGSNAISFTETDSYLQELLLSEEAL